MSLTKLVLKENELGKVMFNKHVRTISNYVGRKAIPVNEVYDVSTQNHGNIEVLVPATAGKKAFPEGTFIKLENVAVEPRAGRINREGSVSAYLDFAVFADDLIMEGK